MQMSKVSVRTGEELKTTSGTLNANETSVSSASTANWAPCLVDLTLSMSTRLSCGTVLHSSLASEVWQVQSGGLEQIRMVGLILRQLGLGNGRIQALR